MKLKKHKNFNNNKLKEIISIQGQNKLKNFTQEMC